MNIALPRTRTGHRAPYLAGLIAALAALTIAAVAGISQLTGSDDGAAAAPSPASPAYVAPIQPSLTLYVVGSDEQAKLIQDGVQQALNEQYASGIANFGDSVVIMKATTAQEELHVSEFLDGWGGSGATVRMFDVRGEVMP